MTRGVLLRTPSPALHIDRKCWWPRSLAVYLGADVMERLTSLRYRGHTDFLHSHSDVNTKRMKRPTSKLNLCAKRVSLAHVNDDGRRETVRSDGGGGGRTAWVHIYTAVQT